MQNRRVAVRAVIVSDDKLLCVRLKKYPGALMDKGQDYWCAPGGGVDIGEPLVAALERELVEELGVRPVVGNLLYIQQFEYKEWEHLEFFFHVTNATDYQNIDLKKTSHGATELAEVSFIRTSENNVLPTFLTKQDFAADTSRGTTQVFNYF